MYKGQGLPDSSAVNFALRLRDVVCASSRRKEQCQHLPQSTRKAKGLRAIRGTASPPLPYKCTATARAPSVCSCCRTPKGELIKDLLLPTSLRTWHRRAGGQLKPWATTIKADLEPISGPRVFGHARWRKDWGKVSSKVAQGRRAWNTSVRDVVNAISDAGSTRPG